MPCLQVAEAALGAIGALAIARPSILVDKRSPAHKNMKQALSPGAPELLKLKALSNLIELLRADEAHMHAVQAEGEAGGGDTAASAGGGAAAKRRGRKKAAAVAEEAAEAAEAAVVGAAVQEQNGEGDTLSQSSSILQVWWDSS
jgi:cohesin loading factor subunit SCC2